MLILPTIDGTDPIHAALVIGGKLSSNILGEAMSSDSFLMMD
jgi:hypothetical protein